jgi:hypothetical protein
MLSDVAFEKLAAGAIVEIDDLGAVFAKPFDAAGKRAALAHNHLTEMELADETTAVPARRKGSDHDEVPIALLTPCTPERVNFGVHARISFLHTPVMTAAKQFAGAGKNGCAYGNAALCSAEVSLFEGDSQHGFMKIAIIFHFRNDHRGWNTTERKNKTAASPGSFPDSGTLESTSFS